MRDMKNTARRPPPTGYFILLHRYGLRLALIAANPSSNGLASIVDVIVTIGPPTLLERAYMGISCPYAQIASLAVRAILLSSILAWAAAPASIP